MKKMKIDLLNVTQGANAGLYKVIRLVNLVTFPDIRGDLRLIGSLLSPRDAEAIARNKRYDVTITQEK